MRVRRRRIAIATLVVCGAVALIAGIAIAATGSPNDVASVSMTATTQGCSGGLPYLSSCTTAQRVAVFQRLLEGGGATSQESVCLAPAIERGFRTDPSGLHSSPGEDAAWKRCLSRATRFDYDRLVTYVSKQLLGS